MLNNSIIFKCFGLVITLMISLSLQAQTRNLTEGEYFWDTDPGTGSATAFTATDGTFDEVIENIINTSVSIPTTTGIHSFNVRVKDAAGNWGPLFTTIVNVDPSLLTTRDVKITAGEYYWDTDPGQGSGTAFFATDGTFDETLENIINNNVNVPSTTGLHSFHVRVQDVAGNWSPLFSTVINVLPALSTTRNVNIMAAEYFWDTDPGQGSGTAFLATDGNFDETLENIINSNVNVPSTLGNHVFNVRVQDVAGNWGPVFSTVIHVLPSITTTRNIRVAAGEYYWDTDPGQGNGTAYIAFDGNFDQTLETLTNSSVSIPATTGVHVLYTRSRDAENTWGPEFGVVVSILDPISSARNSYVKAAEYYFDTDPGQGNATPIVAADGNFDAVLEAIAGGNIPSPVNAGIHALYIRTMDAEDQWGPSFGVVVNIDTTISGATFTTTISGDSTFCPTDISNTYLYNAVAHAGSSFNWIISGGTILSGQGTGSVQVQWDGTLPAYIRAVETGSSFTDSTQINISYYNTPNVGANASVSTICAGESVTLTGSGALSYSWTGGVTDGVAFSPATSQSYTVTGTDVNGCYASAQISITVNAAPNVVANASTTVVCSGSSVTLTGSGAQNYSWNNGVTDGVAFSPVATQSYTVTGTDANGCTATDQVTVNVGTTPTITANATATTICAGESVTLTGAGAQTYSWDNGVTDGQGFSPVATQSYTVTGTDANGCTATDQLTITVNAAPSVVANASSTVVCNGGTVTLTGAGAQSYSWNNGVTDGVAFSPVATQSYTVTGTDTNGCTATDQVTVNIGTTPMVTANATATTICAGEPVTLTGSGAQSYSWNNGVTDGVAFSPVATQNYTVTGTDVNGCTATASVTITVNSAPVVSANASNASICAGDAVTLTGSGALTYSWNNGVTDGVAFNPVATQSYTVTGTDANGCIATDQITVVVNNTPITTPITGPISVSCSSTSATYSVTNTNGSTYTWSVPPGAIILSGQGTNQIQVNFNSNFGPVEVVETDVNGCVGNPVQLNVSCNTAITPTASAQLKVFPNPTHHLLTIQAEGLYQQAQLEVYNLQGQLLLQQQVGPQAQLQVEDWPAATYLGRLTVGQQTYYFQFEKYTH